MYCNLCGTQLPDGSAFCSNCGNRLPKTTPPTYTPPQPTYTPPQSTYSPDASNTSSGFFDLNSFQSAQKLQKICFICLLVASIVMTISVFLPYLSAKSTNQKYLEKHKDEIYFEGSSITCGDIIDISLFESLTLTPYLSDFFENNYFINALADTDGLQFAPIATIIILITGFVAIITALTRNPIPAGIAGIVALIFNSMVDDSISDAKIRYLGYKDGIASTLIPLCAIVVIAAAVGLFFLQKKENEFT